MDSDIWRRTTILVVRRGANVAMAGDGQVTVNDTVMKQSARKVRRLHHQKVIAGFAGSSADALTLFERFEEKLEQHSANLMRAAVELAKDWRTDRNLRRLEALLLVANQDLSLILSGTGDVHRAGRRRRRHRVGRAIRSGRGQGPCEAYGSGG